MKKILSIFNAALFVGLMAMVCSCSQEETVKEREQETGGWHSAKVNFNINCTDFDQGGGATRATTDAWQDGDVVYLLLTDKEGNKVQAYVRYDAARQEWGEVMYEGYKSYLTCTTECKAEAYFIEGVSDLQSQTLSLANDKAVYACTEGTYVYPEDGDMTVTVSLAPLTGRIRFEGASGTNATVEGLQTYASFSRTTGEFTTSTDNVSTTVSSNGSTPYIYSVFADADSPTLTITSDNTYRTVFDASSSVLKPGKSGFLTLPTSEDHRGWMTIQGVTGITLDKTSATLTPGSTVQLTATVSPDNAYDKSVTWSSSNTSVATVDNSGKVTAVADGTATITVQSVSNSNVRATCTVNVVSETRTFTVGGVTFNMKLVEAGTFQMGSTTGYSDEAPVHSVTITKDYYIGETEVTQALWKAVTGYSPTSGGSSWSSSYGLGDNYPAYYISYEDVQSFITKLNSMTGERFRMPTEAEWEFAARGGNKSKGYTYSGSNTIGDVAWYTDNSSSKTHTVKTKAANELG
ncbi:MAG: SUMF1/EgtB/PvdO family nonheme iron enzyme, partial [Prevotella sp.]|nr:SUMF1/EgtB/PvdO family nonheme iron enzyme [Prevotella sp.]